MQYSAATVWSYWAVLEPTGNFTHYSAQYIKVQCAVQHNTGSVKYIVVQCTVQFCTMYIMVYGVVYSMVYMQVIEPPTHLAAILPS